VWLLRGISEANGVRLLLRMDVQFLLVDLLPIFEETDGNRACGNPGCLDDSVDRNGCSNVCNVVGRNRTELDVLGHRCVANNDRIHGTSEPLSGIQRILTGICVAVGD